MRRRTFIGVLTTAVFYDTNRLPKPERTERGEEVTFFVAGVRFSSERVLAGSVEGERIWLRRDSFRGEDRYAVYGHAGRLGFVPRRFLPWIQGRHVVKAQLSRYDSYAPPWKRVQVRVVIASS